MTILQVAKIARQAIHAFNVELNEPYPAWDELSAEDQLMFTRGVWRVLTHPDVTARQQHQYWWMDRIANGWTFGPVKDYRLKTHPCLVAFDELSAEQQAKDTLFIALVKALAPTITPP